ncbi:tripartite tricarboxylate transporter permease, partial [Rhizobium ruizarguesonis]
VSRSEPVTLSIPTVDNKRPRPSETTVFSGDALLSGISFLVVVIGLFGIGELLETVQDGLKFRGVSSRIDPRDVIRTICEMP